MAAIVDYSCSILPVQPVLSAKKEQLRQAIALLEDQRSALSSCLLRWRDVEDYLAEADKGLEKRHQELYEKEKAFEARVKDAEQALDRREELIMKKERLLMSELVKPSNSAKSKKREDQREHPVSCTVTVLDKVITQNVDVDGSDTNSGTNSGMSSDNVDVHLSAAAEKVAPVTTEEEEGASCQTRSVDDNGPAVSEKDLAAAEEETCESSISVQLKECSSCSFNTKKINCNSSNSNNNGSSGKVSKDTFSTSRKPGDLKLRMHLKDFCTKMDGKGMLKYMVERRKDVNALRNELPSALKLAVEPAALVLDALHGYCFADQAESASPKESRVSANKRACILLMESFGHMLDLYEFDMNGITGSTKERAKVMANQWRSRMTMGGDEGLTSNSLDAQAFLQLLVTFGAAGEFKKEELCKLVTTVARRRQTPALCRSLGLTENIPDIVDWLANDGKQVEAISLAHAFGIMDHIQPGPLLKAYLKQAKKSAQTILKSGLNNPAALNDSTTKELTALKNILKCIEEFDLESHFSSTSIQKRVIQLERTKLDRKRVAVAVKAQAKRPRANTVNSLSQGPLERIFHRPIERPQYGSMTLPSYNLAMSNNFDMRNQGNYSSAYRTGNCPPIALPASYLYAADGLPSPVYGSPYANPSPNYGSYQFGSGLTPPAPAYPTQFLH